MPLFHGFRSVRLTPHGQTSLPMPPVRLVADFAPPVATSLDPYHRGQEGPAVSVTDPASVAERPSHSARRIIDLPTGFGAVPMPREVRMAEEEARYSLDRVVRMVLSAIVLAVVLVLLRYLSDVLLPFAAAVVLAYLLNPLVTLFEQKTGRRGAAVAITLCGLGVMGLAVVTLVMPLIAYQISGFGRDLERLRRDIVAAVQVALEPTADAPEMLGAAGGEADATITPEPAAGDASGAETGPGSFTCHLNSVGNS